MKRLILVLVSAILASAALAQQIQLAGSIGVFRPSNSTTRALFGNNIIKYGISPVDHKPTSEWKLTPSVSALSANKNGNKFFVLPATLTYEKAFGNAKAATRPYVRFGAGIAYYDYSLNVGATHFARKTFGQAASAEVGFLTGDKTRVSLTYTSVSKKDGLDFSGLTLSLSYSIAKL